MRLLRTSNPFRLFGYNFTHPLLFYFVRDVRGGRTPAGLRRYTRKVFLVMTVVVLLGLLGAVLLTWPNTPGDDYWYYTVAWVYWMWGVGISIGLFVIVDAVTVFFAAMSIREEIGQPVKFDLLRVSPLTPEAYLASRITLAQVRSWRVFVVMWAGRLCMWGLMVFLGVMGLLIWLYEDGSFIDSLSLSDMGILMMFAGAFLIFSVMFLLEPLWRFRMMAELAASVAARVRRGVWMWFTLGGAVGAVLAAQGAIAVGVVLSSRLGAVVVGRLLDRTSFETDWVAIAVGFVPWVLMPAGVWWYQTRVTRWRRRVAERTIFARHKEID